MRGNLSLDEQALSIATAIINQFCLLDPAQLQKTQNTFFTAFGWPSMIQRVPRLRARGIGTAGEFELNLGVESRTLSRHDCGRTPPAARKAAVN